MLLGLAGRFGIDYILPPAKRLGPVPTTKEIYKENTVQIILQADLQQIKDDY